MKSTVLARVVAVAVAVVALSACSAINPITTNKEYQASDGVRVPLGAGVEGINMLVVTTAKDAAAVLTGSIHNANADAVTVTLSIDGSIAANVEVPADGTVAIGTADGQTLVQGVSPVAPGGLAPVWFGTEELGATQVQVPVVDGTLAPYDQVVDSIPPLPVVTPTPSPDPSASPSPEVSPTS